MNINEHAINYTLKREKGSIVKVNLEIDPSERENILDKTYKYLVQKVSVPGFRKGKTPRLILERFLGEDFYSEAVKIAAREAYNFILKKENLKPYSSPYFDSLPSDWEENRKINLSFTVEVVPEIKIGEYKGLNIEKNEIQVSNEEVNKFIEQLRLQNSKLKPVEDREVIEGDLVYVERETKDGEKLEPLWIRINGSYNPEIEQELIGMKMGEQKIIETTFPEDYSDPRFAGKTIPLTWKIRKIWAYEIIEDYDLAQRLGFSSVEELYEKVREYIFKEKESQEKDRVFQEIIDRILENSDIDPPLTLVLTVSEAILNDILKDLERQGKTLEEYLMEINKTEEEFIESIKESARRNIQVETILDYVAENENIEVTEEELRKAIEELGNVENRDIKILKRNILKNKVKEFLIEENTKKGED
ncbi:MAG: trigger factor [Dictyoglomaceae bacterium]